MGKEGSVAPKERINIVYKPATKGVKEEIELPMKVLVLGDFKNRKQEDTPVEDRPPVNIDKDSFDDVLKDQEVGVNLQVKDRLSEDADEDATIKVDLNFESLNDFDPDQIAQKVPELQKLLELRDALKALKGPLGNVPAFRKKLNEIVKDEETRKKLLDELGLEEGGESGGGKSGGGKSKKGSKEEGESES